MRYVITGAPEPEVAAAIVASIAAVLGQSEAASVPQVSAWRSAGVRDNVRPLAPVRAGHAWHAPIESS